MKRILRIIGLVAVIAGLIWAGGGLKNLFTPERVKAFGDLTVNFHVAPGVPIFSLTNMAPGDSASRPVDVTNGGTIAHMVAVKGIKTSGIGTPHIEDILTIVIKDGATPVYGAGSPTGNKTVQNFFTDSNNVNGIVLGQIAVGGNKTYNITVTFPTSAGNAYQGKSVVLDISFGTSDITGVVINEVFYRVDSKHGHNSEKDRDRERHEYDNKHKNDKDNKNNKNNNNHNDDEDDYDRHDNSKNNNEWVELYNPTDQDISLKNWTLTDNSGQAVIIHANKIIKSHGFVVVAKDDDMLQYFKKHKINVIETGHNFGDGLDDLGDRVILKNNNGAEVDRMSWGTDTSGFTPPAVNPVVPKGSSTERISAGFDTNKATDWHQQTPPTPGH
jgi:hypothetical protein